MDEKNSKIKFSKIAFPAIITILSFICFIIVYYNMTIRAIEPYYLEGLLFLIPTLVFGLITFLLMKNKIQFVISTTLTILLIPIFIVTSFFGILLFALDASLNSINDIKKYERVMRLTGYPNNEITKAFPAKIPQDASEIHFHYNPAVLQGGQNFALRFKSSLENIDNYVTNFSTSALLTGTYNENELQNYYIHANFGGYYVGYNDCIDLPDGYNFYLMYGKEYFEANHGKLCIISINQSINEIIFYGQRW